MLRQQQFEEQEQADLRAEAKLFTQLLHRNIVQFRGAVFRESQCCLVTELAPHGSLKAVLTRFSLPWDLVIKLCVDMASGVQFLHTSGIIHRDIKSDNVLVFSLSPRESVCAKLTDFGSARAGKAHIDAAGQVQLGSRATSRPTRARRSTWRRSCSRDVAPVGGERLLLARRALLRGGVGARAVGRRAVCVERRQARHGGPAPDVARPRGRVGAGAVCAARRRDVGAAAEARPSLDDVLQRLADCQEALGDHDAALETRSQPAARARCRRRRRRPAACRLTRCQTNSIRRRSSAAVAPAAAAGAAACCPALVA
jgi:tRNA A-37 threonylcarbamoyl transferase component Bud32